MSRNEDVNQSKDEKKLSLPPGHPEAGYVRSDLSLTDEHTGILPPAEKAWHDRHNKAREEQVKAVTEREDKAVREERKARE